jgi:IS6 family transposase
MRLVTAGSSTTTYVRVAGRWRYVYRAINQHGQIIDAYVSPRRDRRAARRFFASAFTAHGEPDEIVTDKAPAPARAIRELVPGAFHDTAQYANNRVECDHGRLKARLRPMRGHALMQNIRRGHYELGIESRPHRRVAAAFTELARMI